MNTLTFNVTVNADHLLHLPDELPVGLPLKITIEPLRNVQKTTCGNSLPVWVEAG